MASVAARTTCVHSSGDGQHVPCPSSLPSWLSAHRNHIVTRETALGHTTTWTTHAGVIRLSVTDSGAPAAVCLAHFAPLEALARQRQRRTRSVSLVTATYRFVTVATPGEDVVRTPVGDPLMDPLSPTELFPLPSGLILRTAQQPTLNEHPQYHYLAHPLQQTIPLTDLPNGHTIIFSFTDVPLIITKSRNEANTVLTVWSCLPAQTPIANFPNTDLFPGGGDGFSASPFPSPSPAPSPSNFINHKIDNNDFFSVSDILGLTKPKFTDYRTLLTVSTVTLNSVYETNIHPSKPISSFLSHDAHGLLVLCIVSDSTLTGLSISQTDEDTFNLSPSFCIRDVSSAVPVLAIRRPHECLDTLIQHTDGSMSLFMGRNRLCSVILQSIESDASFHPAACTLAQPVADEFSLLNANTGSAVRFSLSDACFISPMVNQCLAAVTFSFEEQSSVTRITALYHDLLYARTCLKAKHHNEYKELLSSPDVHNVEWSLMEKVLLRIVLPSSPSDKKQDFTSNPSELDTDRNEDQEKDDLLVSNLLNGFENYRSKELCYDDDDVDEDGYEDNVQEAQTDSESSDYDSEWDALLQSEYHQQFQSTTNMEFNSSRKHSPSRNTPTESSDTALPSPDIINDCNHPNLDILRQVLYALHLLYEDNKLRALSSIFCEQLAKLNHKLACVLNDFCYIDHYLRDFPNLSTQQHDIASTSYSQRSPLLEPNQNPVPSILEHLRDMMCGNSLELNASKVSKYPEHKNNGRLNSDQNILLAAQWRRKSPFELSYQIIKYYSILFSDANEDVNDQDSANVNVNASRNAPGFRKQSKEDMKEELVNDPTISRHERVLLALVDDNVVNLDIDALPFGIALPLRDVLWKCRQQPNANWPYAAFALIGREDLFNLADFESETNNNDDEDDDYGCIDAEESTDHNNLQIVRESRALLQVHAAAAAADSLSTSEANLSSSMYQEKPEEDNKDKQTKETQSFTEEKGDGCELEASIFKLRFSQDRRLNEVRRLLRSTDLVVMNAVQQPQQNDAHAHVEFDMIAEQKLKLAILLRKRFASPIGRGAYTLRTYIPTDPTKPLPVPKINMSGIIVGQNAKVTYVPTDTSFMQWGEFHNGVAAGLRIIASSNCNINSRNFSNDTNINSSGNYTEEILTRSWIVNHKPSDVTGGATHAGMLLALGLGGYLPVLRKTDYIQYLVPRHELTAIGLMLGLSAGNIGCADEKITKMLCLHTRPFNEAGFSVPEFQVSVNVQTSAILGLGLLHLGSCEYSLLDGFFSELGRRPKPGDCIDNHEGLSLSIGFSIGLICLGHGRLAFDAENSKKKIETLLLYANGGSINELLMWNNLKSSRNSVNQNNLNEIASKEWLFYDKIINSNNNDNHKLMMDIDLNYNSIIANNQDHRSSTTINAAATAVAESETSRVMEGLFINSDVTSPGALIALGLIFLKTNDQKLAERIILPDSMYSLARVRSDHVYLRLLTRCLIMWDDIEVSESWICKVIPDLLLPLNSNDENFSIYDLQGKINCDRDLYSQDIDVNGILQARAYATAAACTAIALKHAGTNDGKAKVLLMRLCESFEKALVSMDASGTRSSSSSPPPNSAMEFAYGSGLCSTALALSIVFAGSGDISVLKLLRRLRKRGGPLVPPSAQQQQQQQQQHDLPDHIKYQHPTTLGTGRYGLHMGIAMSIGFLFLGGGCQTFGTSNLGIVGLLCSIYTPFPRDVDDNQYHLQAFRHLYVLAVEPRCLETRDVDTGKWCSVDMRVQMKKAFGGHRLNIRAPCIIPESGRIESIDVVSDRYLQTRICLNTPLKGTGWYSTCRSQVIFVKRKIGHLPYNVDPKGSKGILSRILNRPKPNFEDGGARSNGDDKYFKQVEDLVKAFSADPQILAFVKYFCNVSQRRPAQLLPGDDTDSEDTDDDEEEQTVAPVRKSGEREKRYVEIIYECLSSDKGDGIKVYIDLEGAVDLVLRQKASGGVVDSLALCEAYMLCPGNDRLVRRDLVADLLRKVRRSLHADIRPAVLHYIRSSGKAWPVAQAARQRLADALRLNAVPRVGELEHVAEWVAQTDGQSESSRADAWSMLVHSEKLGRLSETGLDFLMDIVDPESES